MSKLRIALIITFAVLSGIFTMFGFLSRLEHWAYSAFYISFLLGLVSALIVIALVLVKPKLPYVLHLKAVAMVSRLQYWFPLQSLPISIIKHLVSG